MKTFNGLLISLLILLLTHVQLKPQRQIKSGVLANGGTSANNANNRIVATIGQSLIGRFGNETQLIRAGF